MKPSKISQVLLVFILMALTSFIAYPAGAQSAPSAPLFTVQYVDHSYDIPPTYGTNPYTGQTTITNYGSHVDNRTVDVTIQNPPFTPYIYGNHTMQLYYDIRCKGHFENFTSDTDLGSHGMRGITASNSVYTTVSFAIQYWNVPIGGQIDFQIRSVVGYTYYNTGACFTDYSNTVAESDWSNTQTITIGNATSPIWTPSIPTPTAPPNPIPTATSSSTSNPYLPITPVQPNAQSGFQLPGYSSLQTALIVLAVVIAILAGALVSVIRWRRVPSK